MKYVCLCYDEEKKLKAIPKSEWDAIVHEIHATNEELRKKGHLISAQALQSVQTATTVRVRDGKVSTTDGPFAETKEQLGGFFLINASDLNEAIQVASRLLGAWHPHMMVYTPYYENSMLGGNKPDSGLPMVGKGGTQFAETIIPVDDRLAVKARLRKGGEK